MRGRLWRAGGDAEVQGVAWLDHEWSETVMSPDAVGWDWIGMNLADGAALTAFRLRRADGSASWAGGSYRAAGGATVVFGPGDVRFTPGRRWTQPGHGGGLSGGMADRHARRAAGGCARGSMRRSSTAAPSTGTAYWEGLSELLDADGRPVGRGYLEMTGYAGRLKL